jgi:hypothetical protein
MQQTIASPSERRPEFVTLIAIYQFITAGILFLLACMLPSIVLPMMLFYVGPAEGVAASVVTVSLALALFLGFGFASIIVGWGLLRMREWARLGSIVLGAFSLIGFPIWTIVSILVLVYMTSEDARAAFARSAPSSRDGDPRYHDALAATAAYKTEPPPSPGQTGLEDTIPVGSSAVRRAGNGDPGTPPPLSDTRSIDPIPMPPPSDPAEATDLLYDEEADVSDHYRRWKASLEREPEAAQEPRDIEAIPMPPPSDPAEATDLLYDEEADVSDHYRRWKASLEREPDTQQEPASEQETREIDSISEQPTTEIRLPDTTQFPVQPEQEPEPGRPDAESTEESPGADDEPSGERRH